MYVIVIIIVITVLLLSLLPLSARIAKSAINISQRHQQRLHSFHNVIQYVASILLWSWLACVESVSVWFRSKERPRNGILGFDLARNETRAKNWKWEEGEGKEGNACRQTPRFWKPAFASERSAWLARLVEQCWHVSIKGLFHTERTVWYVTRILIFSGCCLFWSVRFDLHYKSIFFDLFWSCDQGFRSFNLFSKVPPGPE